MSPHSLQIKYFPCKYRDVKGCHFFSLGILTDTYLTSLSSSLSLFMSSASNLISVALRFSMILDGVTDLGITAVSKYKWKAMQICSACELGTEPGCFHEYPVTHVSPTIPTLNNHACNLFNVYCHRGLFCVSIVCVVEAKVDLTLYRSRAIDLVYQTRTIKICAFAWLLWAKLQYAAHLDRVLEMYTKTTPEMRTPLLIRTLRVVSKTVIHNGCD